MDNLKLRPAGGLIALAMFCAGVAYNPAANAAIYTYVEKDGTRWLTNTPKQGQKYKLVAKYGAPQKRIAQRTVSTSMVPRYNSSYVPAVGVSRGHCGGLSRAQLEQRLDPHLPSIQAFARTYGVEENLVRALMKQESCFNANARSNAGAMGLMQLMPGTANLMGVNDAWDPHQNIKGGVKYLSQMLQEFNGDKALALAAYNAGPGAVKKYSGIPPYRETQNYVAKIMAEYNHLQGSGISSTPVNQTPQRDGRASAGQRGYGWAKPVEEFSVFRGLSPK